MTDEAIFAHAFKNHGAPWRVEDFDPDRKGVGARLLQLYRGVAPDVYAGFIANNTYNAVASIVSKRDLVAIYIGAVETLHRFFLTLLSNPNCLPSIGDASAERDDATVVIDLLNPLSPEPRERYPVDATRALAAKDLAFCASVILFYHEFAHIELCHVSYLMEHLSIPEYSELLAVPVSSQEASLRRTLEWDADVSGALGSLRVWKSLHEGLRLSHLNSMGWGRTWMTAASMLFWIMELLQPSGRDRAQATHPSPLVRLVCVIKEAIEYGGLPEPSSAQMEHDTLVPWIASQFPARVNRRTLPDADTITAEVTSFAKQYVEIADRLEEYQDARTQRTGRPIIRPGYPGRGWASRELDAISSKVSGLRSQLT